MNDETNKAIRETAEPSVTEHRLEVESKFTEPGYTVRCSCGWAAGHFATQSAALSKGGHHVLTAEGFTQAALPLPKDSDVSPGHPQERKTT